MISYRDLFLTFLFIYLGISSNNLIQASVLPIGSGRTYTSIQQAANVAKPGDTLMLFDVQIPTGSFISNISGNASSYITLMPSPGIKAVINGGSESIHFSDCNYWIIDGLTIQGQTGNGMNIDDNGSFATPARHFIIRNCIFQNMNAAGNNDMLKLSGLDSFEVVGCSFTNGAAGGSGIDMVGCHYGVFTKNTFNRLGSNSIQAKGGTQFIQIFANQFIDGGERALNLGGSTGLAFFRPQNATFEAADILVKSNIFVGSTAPIGYVGSTRVRVCNNTIVQPTKWVFRILQETVDPNRFIPCGNNSFCNNIIYIDQNVFTEVNIGPNVNEKSFLITNNIWYKLNSPNWSGPTSLPVTDPNQIIANPQFTSFTTYQISSSSPAIGKGMNYAELGDDFYGNKYLKPPTLGAHEPRSSTDVKNSPFEKSVLLMNNPVRESAMIKNVSTNTASQFELKNTEGKIVKTFNLKISEGQTGELGLSNVPAGIYFLFFKIGMTQKTFIKLVVQ